MRSIPETLSVKDYDQLTMIANGTWYVDHHGYSLGRQMLGVASVEALSEMMISMLRNV